MKRPFRLFCLMLTSCTLIGCSDEYQEAIPVQESDIVGKNEICAEDIDLKSLNSEAKTYYTLLKSAILATSSNLPQAQTRNMNDSSNNPLVDKLEEMTIWDNDKNEYISFHSMEEEQQLAFLEEWCLLETKDMSDKLAASPELEVYVQAQNEIINETIQEEAVQTRSGTLVVKDNDLFFSKIKKRLNELNLNNELQNHPATRISISTENRISTSVLKSCLQNHARRGDFIVSLPVHNSPWVFLNLGDTQFKVGHAAIINANVNSSWSDYSTFTWGTQLKDGVIKETLNYWSVKSYIMGIQKIVWKWKWRGFKSRLYKEFRPISNPSSLADKAGEYAGREYVKWYEFATAKWIAPSRFTCTTLVWYCAKKAYDINVSSWWATMVSPSGLYLDESTYIRKEVK